MRTVKQFIDPQWQEHATSNAAAGFPWAVWHLRRDHEDMPAGLLASVATKERAEELAAGWRKTLRPQGQHITFVCFEGEPCRAAS